MSRSIVGNKSLGLTFSAVFEGANLSYSEENGNYNELKSFSRGNGKIYTYIGRNTLRYECVRLGNEMFNWDLSPVEKKGAVWQFSPESKISEYAEIDLFGYMRMGNNKQIDSRSAVVRISPAISLEPYGNDVEFQTNRGLSIRNGKHAGNIVRSQVHNSFYAYTVVIDLDKIGINETETISNEKRAQRVNEFLEIIKCLSRNIKGVNSNLSPSFIIGGLYPVKNPYFMGPRIKLEWGNQNEPFILIDPLKETLDLTFKERKVKEDTRIGLLSGTWGNENNLKKLVSEVQKDFTIESFFHMLEGKVARYYESIKD